MIREETHVRTHRQTGLTKMAKRLMSKELLIFSSVFVITCRNRRSSPSCRLQTSWYSATSYTPRNPAKSSETKTGTGWQTPPVMAHSTKKQIIFKKQLHDSWEPQPKHVSTVPDREMDRMGQLRQRRHPGPHRATAHWYWPAQKRLGHFE